MLYLNSNNKLLLIEDQTDLAFSIQTYLTDELFVCLHVKNMDDAINKILIY